MSGVEAYGSEVDPDRVQVPAALIAGWFKQLGPSQCERLASPELALHLARTSEALPELFWY
jgi:hypothetical protein